MAQERGSHHSEVQWRAERERDLLEQYIPGLLLALAIFESAMAGLNVVVLSGPARIVMPTLQLVVVGFALLGWWRLRRATSTSAELQMGIGVGMVGLGLLLPLEQALTGNGLLAANLGILIAAAGGFILSHRVFAILVVTLVLAWAVAVATGEGWDPSVTQQAALVVIGVIVGVFAHLNRTHDRAALVRRVQSALENGLRDELTGLWNRRGTRGLWPVLVAGAVFEGAVVWCVFLDVRGLKAVNDQLGHAAGDMLLKGIADVLVDAVPAEVVAVRWGGDEFCLFGTGPPPEVEGSALAIKCAVEQQIGEIAQPWEVSPGLSVAADPTGQESLAQLVDRADEDMYRRRLEGGIPGRAG